MNYLTLNICGINIGLASFSPDIHAVSQTFAVMIPEPAGNRLFSDIADNIARAFREMCQLDILATSAPVFVRAYLSDPANQAEEMESALRTLSDEGVCRCPVSVIGQAPLNGSKVCLLVEFQSGATPKFINSATAVVSNARYSQYFTGDSPAGVSDSESATTAQLERLASTLSARGLSLAGNCLRTWFFVHDIDRNYRGVVDGRNKVFAREGLTRDSHFIASTGIGGDPADMSETVAFNAYSVGPLLPEQVNFLKAPTHLNPTIEYGVAFERGTSVHYGDRCHILISGTASIDNRGSVVAPGDIVAQTERMCENVGALLDEAGSWWGDLAYAVVYLRDMSDYAVVKKLLDMQLGDTPYIIVHGAVCRPQWLVEMECVAVAPHCSCYPDF